MFNKTKSNWGKKGKDSSSSMSDVNNFFFSQEMLMKLCENVTVTMSKLLFTCVKYCVSIWRLFKLQNNQGPIFTLLFSCFSDKSNWEIKLSLYKLCKLNCFCGTILPGNRQFSRIHTPSVDSRCFIKKLTNMFLSNFAMQTWGASGYKPVGEILFLFVILFCCKVA